MDRQRMFAEGAPWHVPCMRQVAQEVDGVATRRSARTIFTCFVPPARAQQMPGMWWNCYEKWPMMTADGLHRPRAVTGGLASPARVFGKMIYSPPASGELHRTLLADEVRTLVLTGGETEACVLAASLDIIDLGCKVMG
ncbi:isochorismatase family protein [Rhizobium laguerreae]|nr:isochorismatase family protein [Rhizobium laguerreae]MBY3328495.1 isochorismatase family protein [Rhizobium laguerreae]